MDHLQPYLGVTLFTPLSVEERTTATNKVKLLISSNSILGQVFADSKC